MSWFQRRGLRVLMYHKISPDKGDALRVTAAQLEEQIKWLLTEGYEFVSGSKVLDSIQKGAFLRANSVLLTFDDAYLDNHELAFPLLKKLGLPAVLFVPTSFIGRASSWDLESHPLMNVGQLREAAEQGIELGLHSHHHVNYDALTPKLLEEDVQACVGEFRRLALPYLPALAYPYGKRPKKTEDLLAMFKVLEKAGLKLAFRIGNRINPLPLGSPYEIQRLGVRGDETFADYKRKIKRGRWF